MNKNLVIILAVVVLLAIASASVLIVNGGYEDTDKAAKKSTQEGYGCIDGDIDEDYPLGKNPMVKSYVYLKNSLGNEISNSRVSDSCYTGGQQSTGPSGAYGYKIVREQYCKNGVYIEDIKLTCPAGTGCIVEANGDHGGYCDEEYGQWSSLTGPTGVPGA